MMSNLHSKTLHARFEEQAFKTPHAIALLDGDKQMTYQTLNEKSNQLAHHLRRHYANKKAVLQPDTLIAICLDRSFDMVIAILGILKAGAAYVPISSTYPMERIQYILDDSNCQLLLTQMDLLVYLQMNIGPELMVIESAMYQQESIENLSPVSEGQHLAYVIYTSGTTGQAKGVMIRHESVSHLVTQQCKYFSINENSKVLQYAQIVFDASVSELFTALLSGAALILIEEAMRLDPNILIDFIREQRISVATLPPAFLKAMPYQPLPSLQTLVVAGEVCELEVMTKWCIGRRLINAYGPTEATVCALMHEYQSGDINTIIGKPLPNIRVYILDKNLRPVPVGLVGELHISGICLASGYLNKPELTADRFIANCYAKDGDQEKGYARLYKTGDLAVWRPDGRIEFRGRNDLQCKLYGYRIELSEIEAVLNTFKDIQSSIVKLYENETTKRLVAYYVLDKQEKNQAFSEDNLREFLATKLPVYMVPSCYIPMECFALTINGKLDRNALPEPNLKLDESDYVPPREAKESLVCEIWQEVLGVSPIGINDEFFRIGGDSILAIQVSARLQRLNINCHVNDIFKYRTISRLVHAMSQSCQVDTEQGILTGAFDLLPVQSWFFEKKLQQPHLWNQSFLVRVPPLSIEKLQVVLAKLVKHHDMMRVCFKKSTQRYRQQIYMEDVPNLSIQILDISTSDNAEVRETLLFNTLSAWQRTFNIEYGPLWQMGYIHGFEDGSARLYIAAHHLIIDTVSWRILIDDIKHLYEQEELGLKSSSYRQWVAALKAYSMQHVDELEYWVAQCAVSRTNAYPACTTSVYHQALLFDQLLTKQLLGQTAEAYHTAINDLLLTALAYTLDEWLGLGAHLITLESHGREGLGDHLDVSRTMGWFTSFYPVKLQTAVDISESIQMIKESLRATPNKGIGFGIFRQQYPTDFPVTLPDISFNYLGQFDAITGDWQLTNEFSGHNRCPDDHEPHLLSLNGLVIDNQLRFSVTTYVSQEDCEFIAQSFKRHLQLVVTHCLNRKPCYTPSDFNTVKISRSLLDRLQQKDPEIEAIYPVNGLQQGFIYHAVSQPDDDAYRGQLLLDYDSAINLEAYKQAWILAIQTYPMLRTYFNWDETLIQITTKSVHLDFTLSDIRTEMHQMQVIDTFLQHDRAKVFDLQMLGLLRLHLFFRAKKQYSLLMSMHHSILDGWSWPVLLQKVHEYYAFLSKNTIPSVIVDDAYLNAQAYIVDHQEEAKQYWLEQMKTVSQANDLSVLLSKPCNLALHKVVKIPRQLNLELKKDAYVALKNVVSRMGITWHVLCQFAWHKLIQAYTHDEQTIVGTTVSGRTMPISGIEDSVGMYINSLPLIIHWNMNNTVLAHLHQIEEKMMAMNKYCFVNLVDLQRESQRLFHSTFVFENYPEYAFEHNKSEESAHQLLPHFRRGVEKIDYPLGLFVHQTNSTMNILLRYDGAYLSEAKAKQLLEQWQLILEQLPRSLHEPCHAIQLLTPEEHQQIVIDWNKTFKTYPNDKTIYQLFTEQVKRTPHHVAVSCYDRVLTYEALDEAVNNLANMLCQQAITRGEVMVLFLPRGIDYLSSMLATWKLGMAFVPLNPQMPIARNNGIVGQLQHALLLTNKNYLKEALELNQGAPIVCVEDSANECLLSEVFASRASDLAYIIFTSGSTGQPKGAMIQHDGAVNHLFAKINDFNITPNDNVAQTASQTFDVSIWQFMAALMVGGRVTILLDDDAWNPEHLLTLIDSKHISILESVPTHLSLIVDYLDKSQNRPELSSLRYLMMNGEALPVSYCQRWFHYYPRVWLANVYGPTECSDDVTHFLFHSISKDWHTYIPIGKPIQNMQIYILDKQLHPMPIGMTGELYVGGIGVGRGYWNLEAKTQSVFIANPLIQEENNKARLYKTGDSARWMEDGLIEYKGRTDFQVKINGQRIELGEIEAILSQCEGINGCVVVVKERSIDGNLHPFLVAYYTSSQIIMENILVTHLARYLPEYMIPHIFCFIEAIPLNSNKKIDRKALPEPTWTFDKIAYKAPRDELEYLICSIWQTILKLSQVGIEDDFFRIGGHSILAIQAAHRMSDAMRREVKVADIFQHRTIGQLCAVLRASDLLQNIQQISDKQVPLSYAQERLWFIEQYEEGTSAYHIPMYFRVDESMNEALLIEALQAIIRRHTILRTHFIQNESGEYVQEVDDALVLIETIAIKAEQDNAAIEAFIHRIFDLTKEHPIRAAKCLNMNTKERFLLLVIHHIAFDEWSGLIFIKELKTYYEHLITDQPISLPPLSIQYRDFAVWQRENLSHRFNDLLNYWQGKLENLQPLMIPTDYPRPAKIDYRGASVYFELPNSLSLALNQLTQINGTTLFTTLLTGLALTLARYTGQSDITIGTPLANRQHPQLANLIGFFVNTLVLRLQLDLKQNVQQTIAAIQQDLLEAQWHQDLPFEKLVDGLKLKRDPSRTPLFQVMYVVQYLDETISGSSDKDTLRLQDHYQIAKFDLTFMLRVSSKQISGSIQYATSLFKQETIERLSQHFINMLQAMAEKHDQPTAIYPILTPKEYQQIIYDWNNNSMDCTDDKTLHYFFEVQAKCTPNNIAVIYDEQSLTYHVLNNAANQLARFIGKQTKTGTLIALCLDRSLEMIIGLLGILKAGNAYVPIDPHQPLARIQQLLLNTECDLILTQTQWRAKLQRLARHIIVLDERPYHNENIQNFISNRAATDLAYVIFTSGSTGVPKGVCVSHRSAINTLRAVNGLIDANQHDRILAVSDIQFDLSVYDIFGILMVGGAVVIPQAAKAKEPRYWQQLIGKHEISIWNSVPALMQLLLEDSISIHAQEYALKAVLLSGDKIPLTLPIQVQQRAKQAKILSLGGATEAAIWSIWYDISNVNPHWTSIPYGRAMPNQMIYVLDVYLNPCPFNVHGEIYIGGAGVALGYWRDEKKTRTSFLEHPTWGRLYKTGDLGYWDAAGYVVFAGRVDTQTKFHGYRIELAEIEHTLLKHHDIQQCVVLVSSQEKNQYLVAYYVSSRPINKTKLRTYLAQYLADYMLPHIFIQLDALPLTINGKLDRKSLPIPEWSTHEFDYVAPRNDLEVDLCQLWQTVLAVSTIGIYDNFFSLGGHSFLAIQLIARMNDLLKKRGVYLTLADLFSHPCIADFSQSFLKSRRGNSVVKLMNDDSIYTKHKPYEIKTIYFIHSALSGHEVYQELSIALASKYRSIGIDNGYLFFDINFDRLSLLAKHYLQQIQAVYPLSDTVTLCGWSLGGNIALEMAYQLEQQGVQRIQVFLLDTLCMDEQLLNNTDIRSEMQHRVTIEQHNQKKRLLEQGVDEEYVGRVEQAMNTVSRLSKSTLSGLLLHTDIVLFKAMQIDSALENTAYKTSIMSDDNDIQKMVKRPMKIVKLNCSHQNIINQIAEVSRVIMMQEF